MYSVVVSVLYWAEEVDGSLLVNDHDPWISYWKAR